MKLSRLASYEWGHRATRVGPRSQQKQYHYRSMPANSSCLLEPLDVALYSPLKRALGDHIDLFIKASINHVTKSEFFIAFKAAHEKRFKRYNMISGFRGTGLVPLDPSRYL